MSISKKQSKSGAPDELKLQTEGSIGPEGDTHRSRPSSVKIKVDSDAILEEQESEEFIHEYPDGFKPDDDLDGDGIIDDVEVQIKVENRKQVIQEEINERIKREYFRKFRKEVDFHHKIAYKYERAYKLGKKSPQKQQELDMEIIDLLSEFSDYI